MIYIDRLDGRITEARVEPLTPIQDTEARVRLLLSRWQLPGGYTFDLKVLSHRKEIPHQVIFADFKASDKPSHPCPGCPACGRRTKWKPSAYSFTAGGITFTVPELGWWECSEGHPGEVYMDDFKNYADLTAEFSRDMQNKYGSFTVRCGRIVPEKR